MAKPPRDSLNVTFQLKKPASVVVQLFDSQEKRLLETPPAPKRRAAHRNPGNRNFACRLVSFIGTSRGASAGADKYDDSDQTLKKYEKATKIFVESHCLSLGIGRPGRIVRLLRDDIREIISATSTHGFAGRR